MASLCSPSYPGSWNVYQTGLKLCLSAGIKSIRTPYSACEKIKADNSGGSVVKSTRWLRPSLVPSTHVGHKWL